VENKAHDTKDLPLKISIVNLKLSVFAGSICIYVSMLTDRSNNILHVKSGVWVCAERPSTNQRPENCQNKTTGQHYGNIWRPIKSSLNTIYCSCPPDPSTALDVDPPSFLPHPFATPPFTTQSSHHQLSYCSAGQRILVSDTRFFFFDIFLVDQLAGSTFVSTSLPLCSRCTQPIVFSQAPQRL
jgi:hypothetical protein